MSSLNRRILFSSSFFKRGGCLDDLRNLLSFRSSSRQWLGVSCCAALSSGTGCAVLSSGTGCAALVTGTWSSLLLAGTWSSGVLVCCFEDLMCSLQRLPKAIRSTATPTSRTMLSDNWGRKTKLGPWERIWMVSAGILMQSSTITLLSGGKRVFGGVDASSDG